MQLRKVLQRRFYELKDVFGAVSHRALITFIFRVISHGLLFVIFLFLAHFLGVAGFGIYVFVWGWMKILMIVGKAGMELAATRYVGAYLAQERWRDLVAFHSFAQIMLVVTSLGLVLVSAVIVTFVPGIGDVTRRTFYIGLVMLPFWAWLSYIQGVSRARQKMVAGVFPDAVLRNIVQIGLILGIAGWGMALGPEMAMAAALCGIISAALAAWLMGGVFPARRYMHAPVRNVFSGGAFEEWGRYGLTMIFISGSVVILNQVDIVMLGILQTAESTGAYGAATRIANLVTFALTAVTQVVGPLISGYYANGAMLQLQRLLRHAALLITGTTIVMAGAVWLATPYMLGLLETGFSKAIGPLGILLGAQTIRAMIGPVGVVMNVTGHQKQAAIIYAVVLIANIALNALLIPIYGMYGAACATGLAILAFSSAMFIYIVRRMHLNCSLLPIGTRGHAS